MNRIAVYGYPGKVWFESFAEIVAELTSEKNSFKMYGTRTCGQLSVCLYWRHYTV